MKIIEIQPKKINTAEYRKRTAFDTDAEILINEDTIITTDGKPVIMYCSITDNLDDLRWAVNNIDYVNDIRSTGLQTNSRTFGYRPRIAMRRDYCGISSLAEQSPKQHYIITNFAEKLTKYYENNFPDIFTKHKEQVENILPNYKIDGSVFTSGIVNKNNALKYHFDSGNFKGVLSNMVALKKNMLGGRLIIPSYNVKLEISDASLTIFDGQSILHGVSNFESTNPLDSYRYTLVYYSLEQMWKCEPLDAELKRIRTIKKQRENKRVNNTHLEALKREAEKKKIKSVKDVIGVKKKLKLPIKATNKTTENNA